jgi:hypothetical protein
MIHARRHVLVGGLIAAACYQGSSSDDAGDAGTTAATDGSADTTSGEVPDAPELGGVGMSGMRRLSVDEYDNTLVTLLGDDSRPGSALLPEDVVDPFDNQVDDQLASRTLIESLEQLATEAAQRLLADLPRRDEIVGCTPVGSADAACMTDFVTRFGRRALRRTLTDEEITRYVDFGLQFATEENDFYAGVGVIVRALLQDPEFVYRVEIGTPTDEPGVSRLNDFEVATRLSYLLWGTTPDDGLLDLAEAGGLATPDGVRQAAAQMLADEPALPRIDRFHAMWLGYYRLPHAPELTVAMRTETRMLLEKTIVTDRADWRSLFGATGTFANDALAEHYGLQSPGSAAFTWVDYGDSGRRGLLSHGSFLSVAGKFGDTSPTQRGNIIRKRLFCQDIPPPPPTVNVDEPPPTVDSPCKSDRYNMSEIDGCAGCHELLDPVGFGLENYDQQGRFRTAEADLPECTIDGVGEIDGASFSGPAGLSDLLLEQGLLDSCVVYQLYEFAMGHEIAEDDERYVEDLVTSFAEKGYLFDELLLDLVADEAFGFRKEEG